MTSLSSFFFFFHRLRRTRRKQLHRWVAWFCDKSVRNAMQPQEVLKRGVLS